MTTKLYIHCMRDITRYCRAYASIQSPPSQLMSLCVSVWIVKEPPIRLCYIQKFYCTSVLINSPSQCWKAPIWSRICKKAQIKMSDECRNTNSCALRGVKPDVFTVKSCSIYGIGMHVRMYSSCMDPSSARPPRSEHVNVSLSCIPATSKLQQKKVLWEHQ